MSINGVGASIKIRRGRSLVALMSARMIERCLRMQQALWPFQGHSATACLIVSAAWWCLRPSIYNTALTNNGNQHAAP
jgi:hypothetical protein